MIVEGHTARENRAGETHPKSKDPNHQGGPPARANRSAGPQPNQPAAGEITQSGCDQAHAGNAAANHRAQISHAPSSIGSGQWRSRTRVSVTHSHPHVSLSMDHPMPCNTRRLRSILCLQIQIQILAPWPCGKSSNGRPDPVH